MKAYLAFYIYFLAPENNENIFYLVTILLFVDVLIIQDIFYMCCGVRGKGVLIREVLRSRSN